MQKFPLFASSVFLSTLALAACSAGGAPDPGGLGETGGTGGTSTGSGGTGATGVGGSTGGTSPRGGSGGTIIIGTGGTGMSGSAGGPMLCAGTEVQSKPVVPTVMVLVDNSSSMFMPRESLWDALYTALMSPGGPVEDLQSKIRFGFASYKGFAAATEEDPACAEIESVPYALDNYAAIDTLYTDLGAQWRDGEKWETPTGHAIGRVAVDLAALQTDPPGPKYILLVTDGNPNTCQVIDPQCGQDFSVRAVQDAYVAGVGTIPLGLGDIVSQPNAGCPHSARCGELHLQDLANAGMGLAVEAPAPELIYEQCNDKVGKVLTGTYSATSPVAENAPFFTASTPETLAAQLTTLLNSVVSCTLDMDAIVTGNPTNSEVLLNGSPIAYGDTVGGWTLEENKYQVTLQGSACTTLQTPGSTVSIKFFCDPETGEPITEPR